MKMTPAALTVGTLALLFTIIGIVLVVPVVQSMDEPSDIARQRTEEEERGRQIYIDYGCQYCHSQYVRRVDWGPTAERVAEAGDYVYDLPQLLGSERTGPDLSQAGGQHTDGWHYSHFYNPRWTRPESVMPPFEHIGDAAVSDLTTYVQSLGGHDADARMRRQRLWNERARRAYESGPDDNVLWIHENVPGGWITVPNPYEASDASIARGEHIYQEFCIGCHGPVGDGQGPAGVARNARGEPLIYPPPLNFTTLRRTGGASGGVLYYQIMNGITGTAMPYFAHELESEKIWDVSNYVMLFFMSGEEFGIDGQAINAAHEAPQEGEE